MDNVWKYKKIKYQVYDNIGRIAINCPEKLNAMDLGTLYELYSAFEEVEKDREIRVVVLSSEGSSFSAGGDLRSMASKDWESMPGLIKDMAQAASDVALKIRTINKPVIASLKGAVAGAGFNMALVCDFRIAADNCKFMQSFIHVGLIPDFGGVFILARIMGVAKAIELTMTGKTINADEAMSMGILTRVVAVDELEGQTLRLARQLSRLPRQALSTIKELVNQCEFNGFQRYLGAEVEHQALCAFTDDAREGIKAFLEKRRPNFD